MQKRTSFQTAGSPLSRAITAITFIGFRNNWACSLSASMLCGIALLPAVSRASATIRQSRSFWVMLRWPPRWTYMSTRDLRKRRRPSRKWPGRWHSSSAQNESSSHLGAFARSGCHLSNREGVVRRALIRSL